MRKTSVILLLGIYTVFYCLVISLFLFFILANLGFHFSGGVFSPLFHAGSIGIIGGADGPTAIYISPKLSRVFAGFFAIIAGIEAVMVLLLFRIEKKDQTKKQ